jgi:aldose 1-epimerase
MSTEITKQPFGATPDGTKVDIFTLRNSGGMEARITNYGGIVVSLTAPDRNGQFADVVLGFETLDDYVKKNTVYFGCLVGRYGNRIAKGQFTLGGTSYTLATNNGANHLHGGIKGFDKVVWKGRILKRKTTSVLELTYVSKDGEEGYPGTLEVKAIYSVTDDNALKLEYTATTDKETICNLTHHSYFNLAGKGDILNHELVLAADKFTPTDAGSIPTGELRAVAGTPFDFTQPTAVGARVNDKDEQLVMARGYDHNWILNKPAGKLGLIGTVYDSSSGRVLEALTTEPAVQFYSGNYLDGTLVGKGGRAYQQRNGLCLEPQHYPDSPNQPQFPSTVLKPGEKYKNTIIYRFFVRK